ncbi:MULTISPECIES: sulfotransferase family protein [unclassified Candidatus Frackibacter]|uniref:sulfotransferase family protein n=1 Tax=unclassified Candidatus Frackibacter TaxID=2648818 RepID=UPI000887189F|nr:MULTISPECIES: sulfotransferase [unclassified Candidatus Frackibacter]SDC82619.1 Sulfotransferase domain-containing protein [Candidatus Frackibacter sp. WG11]SEM97090.1 Sulfotransferase domain-containing protein [Candidatus Frackibacter sp. WG12]SFM05733.1 Sulfotransferase domain-containing protein [Candidatus Frackibacter sp. WG13]
MNQLEFRPNFIIIGAQRCGTTSLYKYLTSHPNIAPAARKEVHFFDNHFEKGLQWYYKYFSSLQNLQEKGCITGEASPYYIFHPYAFKRIHNLIPKVKLIALLRNPIDRAYSHYHHEVRNGFETLSFTEAIAKEEKRLAGELEKMEKDKDYFSFNYNHFSYKTRGIYIEQLQRWFKLFSREQLLIIKSEDLYANPQLVMDKVLEFLELPKWELTEYKQFNSSGDYPEMDSNIRQQLHEYFEPYNQRLYDLLDVNWDWDKER